MEAKNKLNKICQEVGVCRQNPGIKVKGITITRAEGTIEEVDRPKTVSSFEEADRVLREWSETAPKELGYDKCDFTISYEDGETYKGRYDLKHWATEYPNLGKHVRDFVTFHAGQRKPVWMTDEQYQNAMGMSHIQEMKPEFERFLKNYEIPGVQS